MSNCVNIDFLLLINFMLFVFDGVNFGFLFVEFL